jgi:hypothetical protein
VLGQRGLTIQEGMEFESHVLSVDASTVDKA